ncbi:MAG: NAD(P)H-hydrate dehydratase [Clostridiales bacterium]|nr:NAD(P)H-hydrate dehydratase [Clostridiales bacterium]
MYVLTAENMKKAEMRANEKGLTFDEMMERAGKGCAEKIFLKEKSGCESKKAVILAGKGKNGGDGLVIGRYLWKFGFKNIKVILVHGDVSDPLCFKMLASLAKYPVDIRDFKKNPDTCLSHINSADIIIDCIFGIGFKGVLEGVSAQAVSAANANKCSKYAVDIPSGLTADGAFDDNLYFHADSTLSMIAFKPVHVLMPTAHFCGRTEVIDIGVDGDDVTSFSEKYTSLTDAEAKQSLKPRRLESNKGDYGKILTVSGSRNMVGCVYLLNRAAVEIGAGLVTAAFPECIYNIAASKLNEPVFLPLPCEGGFISDKAEKTLIEKLKVSTAAAIGCGLGVTEQTKQIVKAVIENAECPVVLDADGINCIADNPQVLKNTKGNLVLTPHPGEMGRLCGKSIAEIQSDRMGIASEFAREYGVTLVLKGSNTVIAGSDGRISVNTTGNPGMARGGSGDVLTGIIAGLLPQTEDEFEAAQLGAYIHGKAGDCLAEKYNMSACTPTRLIDSLMYLDI